MTGRKLGTPIILFNRRPLASKWRLGHELAQWLPASRPEVYWFSMQAIVTLRTHMQKISNYGQAKPGYHQRGVISHRQDNNAGFIRCGSPTAVGSAVSSKAT